MKHKYIIFSNDYDYYRYMYSDVDTDICKVYYSLEDFINKKYKVLYKLANKNSIFKSRIIIYLIKKSAQDLLSTTRNPIFFIWHKQYFVFLKKYLYEITRYLPNCKNIYYYTDIKDLADEKRLEFLKKNMDDIYIYDKQIADKYHLQYWPELYPKVNIIENVVDIDLFFIGRAKGRINDLYRIAKLCENNEITYKFILLDSNYDLNHISGIEYIHNELPYEKVLEYVKRSNCLLHLINKEDVASLRVQEAVCFKKKLLTNNNVKASIPGAESFIDIQYFNENYDIDWKWVKSESQQTNLLDENMFDSDKWFENIEQKYY